jgi:hypothetical protein
MTKHFAHTGTSDTLLGNFVELSVDPLILNNFPNEQSIASYLSSNSEELRVLRLELWTEVLFLIDTYCTEKQKEILRMIFLEQKTQTEVAKETSRVQSTISLGLCGVPIAEGKRYGGALKKVKRLCAESEKVQEILKKIRETREK